MAQVRAQQARERMNAEIASLEELVARRLSELQDLMQANEVHDARTRHRLGGVHEVQGACRGHALIQPIVQTVPL